MYLNVETKKTKELESKRDGGKQKARQALENTFTLIYKRCMEDTLGITALKVQSMMPANQTIECKTAPTFIHHFLTSVSISILNLRALSTSRSSPET